MCLGIPGLVLEITDTENHLGVVDVGGVKRTVNLACIVDEQHPIERCVGSWVLVHVGFAMQRVDEDEAARTLDLLRQLGEIQAQMSGEPGGTGPVGGGEIRAERGSEPAGAGPVGGGVSR